ncbi:MAG: toxic anion resistance protein [Alphaproteobacteria bacterium]
MSESESDLITAVKSETPSQSTTLEMKMEKPANLVPYQKRDPAEQEKINRLISEIDIEDTHSIISFGAKAQRKSRSIAGQMMEGIRTKDAGAAGALLNEMVATVRGFDVSDLVGQEDPGFFARLLGAVKPAVKVLQRYESVKKHVAIVQGKLEGHKVDLLRDVVLLDRLYKASLEHFHELEDYIAAGEERLRTLDEVDLPRYREEAAASDDALLMQRVAKLENSRNDLERKVHDLRLTRQVVMQSIPSLSLVQENDKSLVTKIDSMLVNTLPLWEIQIAQSISIARSQAAAKTVKDTADLTNDLLEANAKNLRQANAAVRKEIERGIVDVESIRKANDELLATIQESREIYEEGRQNRQTAERELEQIENELKQGLLKAAGRDTY